MAGEPRWLILTLLLMAAVGCYLVGFNIGFGLFLFLGAAFELVFWVELFRGKKSISKT